MAAEINLDDAPITDAVPATAAGISPFGILVDGLNAVGSVIIALMMVMICADVVSRNLLERPISGVSELTAMAVVVIVFLSLGSTLRHGRLSRADLFIDGFMLSRPFAGRILDGIFLLAGSTACALITWATWPALLRAWERSEFVGTQGVFTAPTWPVRLAVMIGASIAALQFLAFGIERFREAAAVRRHRSTPETNAGA